jgi:hypothetical protein
MTASYRPPNQLRIGDAEREAAVACLGEHFAAGRLTHQEYDERSTRAYAARTNGDLWPLFWDLPQLPGASSRGGATATGKRTPWYAPGMFPLLLVVIAVVALTGHPWPLLILAGWLWWARVYRHRAWAHTSGNRRAARGSWS